MRRPTTLTRLLAVTAASLLALGAAGCGDDDPTTGDDTDVADDTSEADSDDATDTTAPVPADAVFAFGLDPSQHMTAAPFPSEMYRLDGGGLSVAPLSEDPILSASASAAVTDSLSDYIADRDGFSFTSPIFFPMNAAPDLASFEGKVRLVTLSGPREGEDVDVEIFYADKQGLLGVSPAFGDYMMPDSRYAVLIEAGVTTVDGVTIESPAGFADVIAEQPTGNAAADAARAAWDWVRDAEIPLDAVIVGTVFTTEATLPTIDGIVSAVDAFTLEAPTLNVRYDEGTASWVAAAPVDGAGLDAYFGTPTGDWSTNPGAWGEGARASAGALAGGDRYDGGTAHFGIGRVLNGTVIAPAFHVDDVSGEAEATPHRWSGGAPQTSVRTAVPFTLFLCDDQLADLSNLPIAVFTHGGSAIRSDAVAFANINCTSNVATIVLDAPFHGGRLGRGYIAADKLVVPTRQDEYNTYTGLASDAAGFVPDHIGDNGAATDSVGPMFALENKLDPMIIEANHLQIAAELHLLVRLLQGGDWSQVQAGLSFDETRIFHQSLSFGTSFTTALMAVSDDFAGVVTSVGSGRIVSANLPMAPNNAGTAAGVINAVLGLGVMPLELTEGAYRNPIVALLQWLCQRSDPLGYAPYVLRYRRDASSTPIISNGDSWDETLFSPAQLSYNNAYGFEVYTAGDDWTLASNIPGADTLEPKPLSAPVAANTSFNGTDRTAAITYNAASCHAQVVTPICSVNYESPHPPIVQRETPDYFVSPICALQAQTKAFTDAILGGNPDGTFVAPSGTCADLYPPM